jgi:D-alanyl-D-alanine carboxypeptidase (penicillin-binding protein 5/6)
MLALVVMEKLERGELRLDERVTASKKAEGMGGSQVFLKAGETFTLNELMQAALVESANDAAYAVAEHAAGSSDEFVKQMNRKAQALGMLNTEFHCVHGLPPSPGGADNLTTCNDMIRLARAALAHPQIIEWTSIEQTTFRNGTLLIHNKNKLVGRLPGVDGLKTGYTSA